MGTPHKHRDAIIAWANGEEIEFLNPSGKWQKIDEPNWIEYHQYRIKPKRVKKEGWVNVYRSVGSCSARGTVFDSREAADKFSSENRIHCIRIDWEEEA